MSDPTKRKVGLVLRAILVVLLSASLLLVSGPLVIKAVWGFTTGLAVGALLSL